MNRVACCPVTFLAGSRERWRKRRGFLRGGRRERDEQEGGQQPRREKRRWDRDGEEESKGPGRGHPPPPPPHSPAHPDYPQPGAGHTVMSIEEVLNLGPLNFPQPNRRKRKEIGQTGTSVDSSEPPEYRRLCTLVTIEFFSLLTTLV